MAPLELYTTCDGCGRREVCVLRGHTFHCITHCDIEEN